MRHRLGRPAPAPATRGGDPRDGNGMLQRGIPSRPRARPRLRTRRDGIRRSGTRAPSAADLHGPHAVAASAGSRHGRYPARRRHDTRAATAGPHATIGRRHGRSRRFGSIGNESAPVGAREPSRCGRPLIGVNRARGRSPMLGGVRRAAHRH
ncbi:conserved hypothetical protein [Burkholderia pseudomallei MSHR346]|nr:conserved hypothetical protein [Burkholderia pseudomallei MSHR346]